MIVSCTIAFLLGFCCGIIPFSYLIARAKGIDLKATGSGNIGATNLGRTLGFPFFMAGFVLDGLKGFVPVMLVQNLTYPGACAGAGAICGHIFNPFFRFRGGKGVSTIIGVTCALMPCSFAISLVVWIALYFATSIVSLASIVFAVVLVAISFIVGEATLLDRVFIALMSLIIIVAHRSNIMRLLEGKEPKTRVWRKQ